MIGFSTGLKIGQATGPGGGPSGGTGGGTVTPATLPVAPLMRWHPGASSVTETNGRVTAASDLTGLGPLTGDAASGPLALTDALGRKFWRFNGSELLNIPNTFVGDNRSMAVFFVGRMHRPTSRNPIVSMGNRAAGTNSDNPGGEILGSFVSSGHLSTLNSFGRLGRDTANAANMIPGAQLQVLGALCRPTGAGGYRLYVNTEAGDMGQNSIYRSGYLGGEIGRYANAGSTAAGNWGMFDLYELILYDTRLTDAEGDATVAALTSDWAIPAVTNQFILEGDSIAQGTGEVVSGLSSGVVVSAPGAGLVPDNWRVLNLGVSGNTINNLTNRRNAVAGWTAYPRPGRNVMAFEIGRNDFATGVTATQHYANVVTYLSEAVAGVLAKGWEVRVMANIATAPALQTEVETFRAMLRAPGFLTNCNAGPGQLYDGQLQVIDTDLIEHGGQPVFATADDTLDRDYYVGDRTHPTILGAEVRVTGGDTPARSLVANL